MPKLEVLPTKRPLKYAGKYHNPGEEIDCSNKDARLLVALGYATYAKPPEQKAMQAESGDKKPKSKKAKQAYKTRDMKAEQE